MEGLVEYFVVQSASAKSRKKWDQCMFVLKSSGQRAGGLSGARGYSAGGARFACLDSRGGCRYMGFASFDNLGGQSANLCWDYAALIGQAEAAHQIFEAGVGAEGVEGGLTDRDEQFVISVGK